MIKLSLSSVLLVASLLLLNEPDIGVWSNRLIINH